MAHQKHEAIKRRVAGEPKREIARTYAQRLAKGTAEGMKQADRHHQENLRPFCILDFAQATKTHPFGVDFDDLQTSREFILIQGKVQNKGDGRARDVFVYLNARLGEGEDGAVRLTRPVLASGLVAAGETATIEVQITERDIMHAWNGEKWNPTQVFHAIAGQTYEVVLEYKDVFGNPFRTVHPRGNWTNPVPNVGNPAARAQMMVRPDKPSPIFLTGTQAVRTLADVPLLRLPLLRSTTIISSRLADHGAASYRVCIWGRERIFPKEHAKRIAL